MSGAKPEPPVLTFTYRNHRGEVSLRRVTGARLWFGKTKYHTDMQWFLQAYDNRKKAARDFAFGNIVSGMEILPPRTSEITVPTQTTPQTTTQSTELDPAARARLDALNILANEETPTGERPFVQSDIRILLSVLESLLEMNAIAVERIASLESRAERTKAQTAKFNKTVNDLESRSLSSEGASASALLQNLTEDEFAELWRQVQSIRNADELSES